MYFIYLMIMRTYKYLLLILIFIPIITNSQSLVGTQSNYSGTRSLFVNPSMMTNSHVYMDFSPFSFGLSVYNDYMYIKGSDVSKMLFNKTHPIPEYQFRGEETNFLLYDNPNNKPKNLYESLDVNLLGFMYNIGGNQAVGFSLNGRVYTSANNVPYEIPGIGIYGIEDSTFYKKYSSSDVRISTMEWAEIAFAYSRKIYERYLTRIDAGVSVKYLLGYSAVAGNMNSLSYEILSEDSVIVNTFDADLAYSIPINYDVPFTSDLVFDKSMVRGDGIAFDFGFTYIQKKVAYSRKKRLLASCMQEKLNYQWKLALSIMDLGFINFDKNAMENRFYKNEDLFFDVSMYDDIETFDDLSKMMSGIYYNGDSLASRVGANFKMGLPTTLRIQFDYNLAQNIFVNASFVQPLKLLKYSVEAIPQILLEPRYESDHFDFSIPITLRNYRHLCIGAAARFDFITIGTQNLASYLGFGNVNGMDLFISLKFNFIKGRCTEDKFDACWSADVRKPKRRR